MQSQFFSTIMKSVDVSKADVDLRPHVFPPMDPSRPCSSIQWYNAWKIKLNLQDSGYNSQDIKIMIKKKLFSRIYYVYYLFIISFIQARPSKTSFLQNPL